MKIEFTGPVYPINQFALQAFAEILNSTLAAEHVTNLNRILAVRDATSEERKLGSYFKWNFDNRCFNLWQRTSYNSDVCFGQQVFRVDFNEIGNKENKPNTIIN